MSNAAASVASLFDVIRRCDVGECERGCDCDHFTVNVDVDELTNVEIAHFQAHGTPCQRAAHKRKAAPPFRDGRRPPMPKRRPRALSTACWRRPPRVASQADEGRPMLSCTATRHEDPS